MSNATRLPRTPAAAATTPAAARPEPDQVAIKAYEIYCARGCADGHDLDDWIEAERQLREVIADESQGAVAAPKA